ncbi:paraquat-inducible protein A [Pedobacter frigiditerrae]|uniref:Paraquat-inducible protein A n=1 Tax=Pedobacter frigiditerrae TaxID=2530452 RepID=A0A4R0MTV5_9SPHI|nr:paraquat-inducible protein A [Pedobacter frigiditerrae]TCC90223.1 paraquat-inducible protein A [Pedobacter frigiditerrae]
MIIGLSLLLIGEGYFGIQLHELSERQERLKKDFADMNNINLGLFSVDQWHDKVEHIIKHQVRDLNITAQEKKALQKETEGVIIALINKAEALVIKPEKKSLRGKLVKFAVKNFVNVDTIKKQVPGMARTMMKKIDNPNNKKQLSKMALQELDKFEQSDVIDSILTANAVAINKVYKKYKVDSNEQLNQKIQSELKRIETATYTYCSAMLICIVLLLTLWWIFRKQKALHATLFIMSLLFAFILLGVGLTASMIEVDARINALDFVLLGQHVSFPDQVLFFESKSILDVVIILVKGTAIDSILVGVLILVFSILFPIMKLSSTGIHLLGRKSWAENKVIKYFAFQSGKWSMADVFVIAILMAYIGLNGLLENQLQQLNVPVNSLTMISTHNTALQPGYIIFIAFVLFGLILSTILKFITPNDAS